MNARTSFGKDFQDGALARLMQRQQVATLYLQNRLVLRGRIQRFDSFVVMIAPLDGGPSQMIYKSALVSISGPAQRPERPPGRGRRSDGEPRPEAADEGASPQDAPG